jgi:hypothetical protein
MAVNPEYAYFPTGKSAKNGLSSKGSALLELHLKWGFTEMNGKISPILGVLPGQLSAGQHTQMGGKNQNEENKMIGFFDIPTRLIDLTAPGINLVHPITEIDCSVHDPNDPLLFQDRAIDYDRPSYIIEAIQDDPERHLLSDQRPESA